MTSRPVINNYVPIVGTSPLNLTKFKNLLLVKLSMEGVMVKGLTSYQCTSHYVPGFWVYSLGL